MAFTYNGGANPSIDYVRLLISDTNPLKPIFSDSEIISFANITAGVWQSSMFYSGTVGQATLPATPVNYLRTAALALDSLANNKARLSAVTSLLDVKIDPSKAADQLRKGAQEYRQVDDDSMAFVIIEQCNTDWSFKQRFWSQWQRTASM